MSTFREKHMASTVLADLIEDCGEGYCRYKDPNMTDQKAAEHINATLGDKIREPFDGTNICYIRTELFGKLYDKDGGRARPMTADEQHTAEALKRTRDELFSEVGLVRKMAITMARRHRDLLQTLGEPVPEDVIAIAEEPTWHEH